MSTAAAPALHVASPPPSASYESFTGRASTRYPAPDVARGLMLLLIALANVHIWMALWPGMPDLGVHNAWDWVSKALIDQRAYPLFALLFGFGLVTMSRRRINADVERTVAAERDHLALLTPSTREGRITRIREAATHDARRMVRRRGLWMLAFGAVHALIFGGDIIGAYGLIAVLFAGAFVHDRRRTMWVAGVTGTTVAMGLYALSGWTTANLASGAIVMDASANTLALAPSYPLASLTIWAPGTVMTALASLVMPAAFLGAAIARTDLLTRPQRHRRTLVLGGTAALGVGALASVPTSWIHSGGDLPFWATALSSPVSSAGGLLGACGWLALLAAYAGGAGQQLRGVRRLAAAVGKRSMTAYISQSVLFMTIFATLVLTGGSRLAQLPVPVTQAWTSHMAVTPAA